ncbi:MAG: hypothetical protein AAFX87_22650 [Bacteroidota bacterium]
MSTEEQLKEERDKIVKGLEETYRRLVEYKKYKRSPIVVEQNGEVIEIDPNDIAPTTTYKRGNQE